MNKENISVITHDELLSKTISYLRFPLTVGVVFIHFDLSKGLDIAGATYGLNNPDWYYFIINLISGTLATIGVPLFFLISGFLFFYRRDFDETVYKQKLKSRFMTLFIPYVLWNMIAIVWQLKCFLPGVSAFYPPVEMQITPVRVFNTFFCNQIGIFVTAQNTGWGWGIIPIDVPLWYVRDLMVMVILSPIIHWLTKKTRFIFVVISGLLWFFTPIFLSKESPIEIYLNMLITTSFFFSLGAYYSIYKENFVIRFRHLKYSPYIYACIAVADVLTKRMDYNSYIHKVGILLGIVSIVLIASWLLENRKVKVSTTLTNSCFFIFALHFMIITNIGKMAFILMHIPNNNPVAMLALYFGTTLVTVLLCLGLYVLLKRFMPKTCCLLTGGR